MLGIGWGEMVLIGAIALVIMGPEKFPEFAKVVIRTVRDIRGYMDEVRDEVSKELRPVQNEVRKLSRYDPETYLNKLTEDEAKAKTPTVETTGERAYESGSEGDEVQPGADHADSGYYDDQGYYEEPDFGYPEGEAEPVKTGDAEETPAETAGEAADTGEGAQETGSGAEEPREQTVAEGQDEPAGDEPSFYEEDQDIEIPERLDG